MKRPSGTPRPSDDKACRAETGRSRAEWFSLVDKSGASGRAGVGKTLQTAKLDAWWLSTLVVDYEAHKGVLEKDGRPKGYSICSTKTVSATASRTFQALTTSRDLAVWFGAGAEIKAAVGGAIRDNDGVTGKVTKLRPDKAIVFTWDSPEFAPGSVVEILVQPKGDKTGIVVNHTRVADRRDADDVREAWTDALNRLKAHLEG